MDRSRRSGGEEGGSEGGWSCRASLTFPTQQEVRAKDRNPQADLSTRSPALLAVPLLAQRAAGSGKMCDVQNHFSRVTFRVDYQVKPAFPDLTVGAQ